jgi:uncharacterized membrane protein (GlpM family)
MSRTAFCILCCAGILFSVLFYGPSLRATLAATNDFMGLYPGGRLAGTPHVYDPQAIYEIQRNTVGYVNPHLLFIRPPFEAALLWPIARLPYRAAYLVYQLVLLGATVSFIFVWPLSDRKKTLLACCWSLPLFCSFAIGQDEPLLLIAIGLAVERLSRGRDLQAGMVFALCAIKPHLFLLLPLWIVARQMWRFAGGLLFGGGILAALSFLAAGPHWMPDLLRVCMLPQVSPAKETMPNLYGLFGGDARLEFAGAVVVAIAVWYAARRGGVEYGLTAAIAGGLLTSHHAYLADCLVLLPALLIASAQARQFWQRCFANALLAPVLYLGAVLPGEPALLTRAALIGFVLSLAAVPRAAAERTAVLHTTSS